MPAVHAVSSSPRHDFCKENRTVITLIAGIGVAGDAHAGPKVQHGWLVKTDPERRNLRQVHLIELESYDGYRAAGFDITAGQMGENITTSGINLVDLPLGTRLHLGAEAVIELTGLRRPCGLIDDFRKGLLAATVAKDERGNVGRRVGVMSIVLMGGEVRPGDNIVVEQPEGPPTPLGYV